MAVESTYSRDVDDLACHDVAGRWLWCWKYCLCSLQRTTLTLYLFQTLTTHIPTHISEFYIWMRKFAVNTNNKVHYSRQTKLNTYLRKKSYDGHCWGDYHPVTLTCYSYVCNLFKGWATVDETDGCPPGQNDYHVADGMFRWIFVNEKFFFIFIKISLKSVASVRLTINQHWFR